VHRLVQKQLDNLNNKNQKYTIVKSKSNKNLYQFTDYKEKPRLLEQLNLNTETEVINKENLLSPQDRTYNEITDIKGETHFVKPKKLLKARIVSKAVKTEEEVHEIESLGQKIQFKKE